MKNKLVYEHGTKTIRQKPGNYLIAMRGTHSGWICEPDLACDLNLAVLVFKAIHNFSGKYADGETLLKKVALLADKVRSVCVDSRSVEIEYGRGCNCTQITDELSRTLDEIAEAGGPRCPNCSEHYRMTSVCVLLKENQ